MSSEPVVKLRLKQEDYLEDRDTCCMRRFKQHTVFELLELTNGVFHGTSVPKKTAKLKHLHEIVYFVEWEPGLYAKSFEVLSVDTESA